MAWRDLARCLLACRGVIPRRPPRRDPSRPAALIPRPCRGVIPRRPPWSAPLSKARPPVRFHRRGDDVCAGGLSIRNDVGGLPLGALPFLIRTALRTYRPGSWRGGVARRGRVSRSPGSVRRGGVAGRGRVSRSPGSVRRGGPARSGRARGAASGRRPLRRRHPSQGCRASPHRAVAGHDRAEPGGNPALRTMRWPLARRVQFGTISGAASSRVPQRTYLADDLRRLRRVPAPGATAVARLRFSSDLRISSDPPRRSTAAATSGSRARSRAGLRRGS